MKNIIIAVSLVILNACSNNAYIAPVGASNAVLDVFPPTPPKSTKYVLPRLTLYIDGKRVNSKYELYPEMPILVTPGSHKLNLEITAYIEDRAKFVKLELEPKFEEFQEYKLLVVAPKTIDGDILADLPATVKVVSDRNEVIYIRDIVLADDWGRSAVDPEVVDKTMRAIISTIPY